MKKIIKILDKPVEFEYVEYVEKLSYDFYIDENYVGTIEISPKIDLIIANFSYVENYSDIISYIELHLDYILKQLFECEYILYYEFDVDNNIIEFKINESVSLFGLINFSERLYIGQRIANNSDIHVFFGNDLGEIVFNNDLLKLKNNFEIIFNVLQEKYGKEFVEKLQERYIEFLI